MFRRQKWWDNPSKEHKHLYMKRFRFISPLLGNGPAFRSGFFPPHWQVLVGYVWYEDCDWWRAAYVTAASRRTPLRTKTRYIKACHKYMRTIQLQSRASAGGQLSKAFFKDTDSASRLLCKYVRYCKELRRVSRMSLSLCVCVCVCVCVIWFTRHPRAINSHPLPPGGTSWTVQREHCALCVNKSSENQSKLSISILLLF